MVDVSELTREGALSELLYVDDLMSEAITSLKVTHGKTNLMVSAGITKDCLIKSKIDPCGVCSLRVKANSVLCVHCGMWI